MQAPTHRFQPKAPWFGGDLQTVRNTLARDPVDLGSQSTTRLEFDMDDGTGDRLFAVLDAPISKPTPKAMNSCLIILVHGMSGCEDSPAMRNSARFFLSQGFPTLRLNLRGAGAFRRFARETYHAGRSRDLAKILSQLDKSVASNCFLIGHSLGGNMLIKAMSEQSTFGNSKLNICGAAALCAPIDMQDSAKRFSRRRNFMYQRSILGNIKRSLSGAPNISSTELKTIADVRTLHDLDHTIVAPSIGLSSAEEYYAQNSGQNFLPHVRVPMLVAVAQDDHWVSVEAYEKFDWSQNPNLKPLITNTGGHCGFHEQGFESTWFDRQCLALLISLR